VTDSTGSTPPSSLPDGSDDRSLLRAGDAVLLVDRKKRQYLTVLADGGEFHTHAGVVPHTDLIGRPEGAAVRSGRGAAYTVIRPTLSEYILNMKRGAQVIYPKDLGPILMLADIFPGARVVESGVGSGALAMTLIRAGAVVTGYEIREDFAARAMTNIEAFHGDVTGRYEIKIGDIYEGIAESGLDRILLDLPEPWRVVEHAATSLRPGGILVAYTPSITQAAQLREALAEAPFDLAETVEVLNRGWHVEGRAVRPNHRMVAHTAFLTSARRIEPIAPAQPATPDRI